MKFITKNSKETQSIAARIAKNLLKKEGQKKAFVVALSGNLGAGKTTFVQGFARALGIKERPKSPTFILMQIFEIGKVFRNKKQRLIHIDAYRIEKPKDMLRIGFKEIMRDPENIVLIEWAEKIKKILPKDTVWIRFIHEGKNKRSIEIKNYKF
ncbi:MAG: tRNA (adenosine(37)-N6)-threonylcarbamoyltransferase complex ATPase subunit type 1 TsaE [Candidatus Sungbacteria bacterium]|nr:tRNA (adenosine(37)-N6)-threonylcarbamoyltransferase complex ATPase subunit type 1 TsaE [Candidatus Sungbacteria bacterium]